MNKDIQIGQKIFKTAFFRNKSENLHQTFDKSTHQLHYTYDIPSFINPRDFAQLPGTFSFKKSKLMILTLYIPGLD